MEDIRNGWMTCCPNTWDLGWSPIASALSILSYTKLWRELELYSLVPDLCTMLLMAIYNMTNSNRNHAKQTETTSIFKRRNTGRVLKYGGKVTSMLSFWKWLTVKTNFYIRVTDLKYQRSCWSIERKCIAHILRLFSQSEEQWGQSWFDNISTIRSS